MTKKILMTSSIIGASILFTGCATLFGGGSTQSIHVQSSKNTIVDIYKVKTKKDESTEKIIVDEKVLLLSNVQAPTSISVNRDNKDILVEPKDPNCKEVNSKGSVNGWFWVNILGAPVGTFLSSTTDAVSGAMWTYDENIQVDCK